MSTIQVANVHLESSGNNRIQYAGSNTVEMYAGGTKILSSNSSGAYYTGTINANNVLVNGAILPSPGELWGMIISNNGTDSTNDLDISAGYCADDTNTVRITLPVSITKQLDATWAVGTNQGGLDTGTAANTTYHIFAIYRSDTGVSDVIYSASLSPTLPANYTHKRRILSLQRVSGSWQQIYQHGDYVFLKTAVDDVNAYALTTSATDFTLASIPNGIVVMVHMTTSVKDNASLALVTVFSKQGNDINPSSSSGNPGVSATGATATQAHSQNWVLSNSSQQIRADAFANVDSFSIVILGWIDYRGKQF